ncbi:unnamed protein product [Ranitomeya imitator]|uniref:Uncharacterized protein n=1 Tax=Ranitomeya imitator TaxID=111125 RepID=A0ABN9L6W6_9NEOB|nr:unnamed protein product [Ranitomeya imitator]
MCSTSGARDNCYFLQSRVLAGRSDGGLCWMKDEGLHLQTSLLRAPRDLNLVLNYLRKDPYEPLDQADLKLVTFKTVLLLAITSARRIGEIQVLSIRDLYLRIQEDCIILKLDPAFLSKVVTDLHRHQEILWFWQEVGNTNEKEGSLHSFNIQRTILQYLKLMESWRMDSNLFIQIAGKNKGKKASKATLARWIKSPQHILRTDSAGKPQGSLAESSLSN